MDYHVAWRNSGEEQLQMTQGNTCSIILSERRQSQLPEIDVKENIEEKTTNIFCTYLQMAGGCHFLTYTPHCLTMCLQ